MIVGKPRPAGPLGNNTKLRSTPPNYDVDGHKPDQMSRSLAYRLKAVAAELLPNERVCICMNHRVDGKDLVDLNIVGEEGEPGRAYFSNLMVCRSVWVCPLCGRRIAEERRVELQDAIDIWHMAGGSTLFLTQTLQHGRYNGCVETLDGLNDGSRRLWNSRPVKRLVEQYGIEYRVWGVENTWGPVNGHHPHRHTILFLTKPLTDNQIDTLEREMSANWGAVLGRCGHYASSEYGLKLIRDHDKLAGYLNKFGHLPNSDDVVKRWTGANELTKGNLKLTWGGETFTPIDLLAIYEATGEPEIGLAFQEYAEAFKGRKQLVWSRGLKARIEELRAELYGDPEPEPPPEPVWTAVQFPDGPWKEIKRKHLQPKVLNLAENGADVAVKALLESNDIFGCYYPHLDKVSFEDGVVIDLYEYVWGEARSGDLAGGDLAGDDLAGEAVQNLEFEFGDDL